jgi:hypothetical protein
MWSFHTVYTQLENKIQPDASYYFIMPMLGSTPKAVTRVTAFGPDTHPSCLHLTSNQQQLQNQTAYVVTKRYRRELLMMGIMVPETC